ncbi:hypothetical protein B7R21_07805 [Subtercola boreus]|uniref:Uncharacterized protein n=1 Tax=Subtercola boreus TaxID=120213 RepID=A0A3E0VW69_9MICO|nr:hypothetical protein [Subtercola boreus]RFA13729.1 hypothetical protein B7R21_07805 [Subtercola boreus]
MTIDILPAARSLDLHVLWIRPDTDLWVAQGSGEFIGMVEFVDGHFVSTDRGSRVIDSFSDLPAARQAVVNHATMLDSFANPGSRRASARRGASVSARFLRRTS